MNKEKRAELERDQAARRNLLGTRRWKHGRLREVYRRYAASRERRPPQLELINGGRG